MLRHLSPNITNLGFALFLIVYKGGSINSSWNIFLFFSLSSILKKVFNHIIFAKLLIYYLRKKERDYSFSNNYFSSHIPVLFFCLYAYSISRQFNLFFLCTLSCFRKAVKPKTKQGHSTHEHQTVHIIFNSYTLRKGIPLYFFQKNIYNTSKFFSNIETNITALSNP